MGKKITKLSEKSKLNPSKLSIAKTVPLFTILYLLTLVMLLLVSKTGELFLTVPRLLLISIKKYAQFKIKPPVLAVKNTHTRKIQKKTSLKSFQPVIFSELFAIAKSGRLLTELIISGVYILKKQIDIPSAMFLFPRALNVVRGAIAKILYAIKTFIVNILRSIKNMISRLLKRFFGFFNWKIITLLSLILLGAYTLAVIKLTLTLPSPDNLDPLQRPLTTKIYDRNGNLLFQFYEGKNRDLVKLSDVPTNLVDATIAIEDKNFYTHRGVDMLGIIRAIKTDYIDHHENLQGASTITQQVIKNTLLTPNQTYSRKIKEILLSLWTEMLYSKNDILTMYFNEVPYGGPAWGVEAASEMYFDKKVNQLNLAQSAFLAGLPAAPSEYSPYGIHPELAKTRQKEVLQRMVDDGYIDQKQATIAYNEPLNIRKPDMSIQAPHFVMYVKQLLTDRYGEKTVAQGGLRVVTTLDLNIQHMAERVVAEQIAKLSSLDVSEGAAMITDAKTGQILAMVGSKNYFDPHGGNVNATLSIRPPGSSIKVVTYATAFKEGFTPGSVLLDTPTTFPNPWGQPYTPVNYDGLFHGAVTIRTALGSSFNIPAVKTLATVGVPAFLTTAKDMGITTFNQPQNYGLSITLGGAGTRMTDMMTVYGTLASEGIKNPVQPILTVTDSSGNILENHRKDQGQRVITPQVTYLLTNILSDNHARTPAFGPNSLLVIKDHPDIAVKTGTSDDKRDNWAFGYTPDYVVGAWVGNFNNSPMNQALSSGITGATPIWHDLMTNLVQNIPDEQFQRPDGIVETVSPDGRKDLAVAGSQIKTMISYKKISQTNQSPTNQQKEVMTYTDPFSTANP